MSTFLANPMVKRKTHLGGDVRRSRRIRRHLRLTTYVRLPLVPDSRIPIFRLLSRLGLVCPAGDKHQKKKTGFLISDTSYASARVADKESPSSTTDCILALQPHSNAGRTWQLPIGLRSVVQQCSVGCLHLSVQLPGKCVCIPA